MVYYYVPRNFEITLCKLEISNLRNYFINCAINSARRIAQFVNSDLGLDPRPHSLAAVTQLGWKLHYSPATVIQPSLSLCRSR